LFAKLWRDDQTREFLSDGLFAFEAEYAFGCRIKFDHATGRIDRNDAIQRRIKKRAVQPGVTDL